MKISEKIIAVLCCMICLSACKNAPVTDEVPVVIATTEISTTAIQTTQTTTETATVPVITAENVNKIADIEVPENTVYKKTKYIIKNDERQITEISFFDEHDNIICNVNPNLDDNIYSTMLYVYKYNDDNTISSKKFIAENGITSINEYEYNDNGTLKSISYFSEGGDLVRTECYEYNENGDILSKNTFNLNESEPYRTEVHKYEYDENGRIINDIITKTENKTGYDYDETETIDYTYDYNGNILTEHSVRSGVSHTLAMDTNEDNMIVYTYNSGNQCILAEITDKYGNISIIEYEFYK